MSLPLCADFQTGFHALCRHVHVPSLISSGAAPITSPVRAAVRIRNSSAPRGNTVLLPEPVHEGRQFAIEEGCMVPDASHPRARGKQLVQMPAPARRILALAIAMNPGPIENEFDTPA